MKNILTKMNLFVENKGYAGAVTEFTPPKLTLVTEEIRTGGMDAPVEIPLGLAALTADFTLTEFDPDVLTAFGVSVNSIVSFSVRGALDATDGTVTPLIITMRGRVKELDMGAFKPGAATPLKCSMALTYYKMEHGGKILHEIDPENMVRVIDGTDRLAAHRNALGI